MFQYYTECSTKYNYKTERLHDIAKPLFGCCEDIRNRHLYADTYHKTRKQQSKECMYPEFCCQNNNNGNAGRKKTQYL